MKCVYAQEFNDMGSAIPWCSKIEKIIGVHECDSCDMKCTLEELERLAEIGKALEWAENNFTKSFGPLSLLEGLYLGDIEGYNIKALLEAYRQSQKGE